jgi:hypothetical protein
MYQINGSIISEVIEMFTTIVEKYQQKHLYVEDYSEEESNKNIDRHFLTLEQFYEQKLEKSANMIE